jgi:hypothetical protein
MMEALHSSETAVLTSATRRNIPEDYILQYLISLVFRKEFTFIKDVSQEKSINHHDKLGNHSNPILQLLLEQQQRRPKKLWPADLIDG